MRAAASRSSKGRQFRTAFSFVTRCREEKSPRALFLTRLTPGVVCIFRGCVCRAANERSVRDSRSRVNFRSARACRATLEIGLYRVSSAQRDATPLYGLSRRYVLLCYVHKEFYLCVGQYTVVVVAGQQNVDLCV